MRKLFFLVPLFLVCCSLQARTYNANVTLLKIEEIKTDESREELYIHVTHYHEKGDAGASVIPEHPMYWPSEHLSKVSDVALWDGELKEGQSVVILISLMEKDFPPWNTDDLVGTVRLRLKNDHGDLVSNWSIPNSANTPETINTKHGPAQKFVLLGSGNKYVLYLKLSSQ